MNPIKSAVSWVMNVIARDNEYCDDLAIYKGARIRTKYGMGEVVGGSFSVKLDRPVGGRHENNRTWSFNIDAMRLVEKGDTNA